METKENATGQLFGKLFPAYDRNSFLSSMDLLEKRFIANNFPMDWFKGRECLDVGCGGGRYSMALARLGANHCVGIDLAEESIRDAEHRASELDLDNVKFRVASAAEIPFEDHSFDCVLFSGVLQHVAEPITVLNELSRVTRPGGMLFLLVYATEGVRWPLIQMLRPIAQTVGFEVMDQAVASAGLPVNKRRTYLDDLFVPYIDFYSRQCLSNLLYDKGFSKIERWENGRFDHEESLDAYVQDLEGLSTLFSVAANSTHGKEANHKYLIEGGKNLCESVVGFLRGIISLIEECKLSEDQGKQIVIGQGHHRIVAWKDKN